MRLSALLYMYRRRLRSHGLQELLAGIGIAIAVALVFTAVLSESSISSSAARVVKTVIGPASLQLRASDGEGFEEAVIAKVQRLPGVRQAAPLLEDTASLAAGGRRVQVQLAGTDLRLAVLDGLAETLPIGSLSTRGIGLTRTTAQALGIAGRSAEPRTVGLSLRGRAHPLRVTAVLGPEAAGALSGAYVAVMPLARMQELAGLPGRISRIFVQTQPGRQAAVRRELSRLAGGRLQVAAADQDVAALGQALGPSNLASGLFAAIGALLGLLLAFSAMLLSVAERRRSIADLRLSGASRASVVEMVAFEALCLGVPASLIGLLAGYLLCTSVLHPATGYLAEAFTLSGSTVLQPRALALSFAGGVLASCAASAVPLLDLRPGRARDAIYEEDAAPGNALDGASLRGLAAAALCLAGSASVLWLLLPAAAIPATAMLALMTVLAVPLAFAGALAAAAALSERMQRLAILPLALASLRATTVRSLALAATGAVALFGSVALGGARQNLLSGIGAFARSYVADASIWVTNPGDNQAVDAFRDPPGLPTLAKLPGVAAVRSFQGSFLQLGARRAWVIARPPGAERHVLESQLRSGDPSLALARLAHGGWIAVSQQIAAERRLHIGSALTLPTPTGPSSFRIAATTTNLAWPPGVIFMSSADYTRAWASSAPTALGVQLLPGADASAVRSEVAAALGASSGLEVSLAAERAARIDALAGEGLGQLQDVSTMLLIAAIGAMIAALASSVWQRRSGLASLRLMGASRLSLQGILLIEALLMLGAGCLTGALAGIYGQLVINAFLRHVTGFPLISSTTSLWPLEIFVLVLAIGLAAGAIPGWLAARVRPALALVNE
jgi:putative ABC transport system permease protein